MTGWKIITAKKGRLSWNQEQTDKNLGDLKKDSKKNQETTDNHQTEYSVYSSKAEINLENIKHIMEDAYLCSDTVHESWIF